jgi:hypothetical protein
MFWHNIKLLFLGKIKLADIIFYFEGTIRHKLYYSKFRFLIRKHILAQIGYRVEMMNKDCYWNGSCVECGCATLALQMCGKSCDGKCYPPLMNKSQWDGFISKGGGFVKNGECWVKKSKTDEPILFKETHTGYVRQDFNYARNYKS